MGLIGLQSLFTYKYESANLAQSFTASAGAIVTGTQVRFADNVDRRVRDC
jgi:hypothetical protein